MLLQFLIFSIVNIISADKCYSCSSTFLHSRWPKDEDTNQLQYLSHFPWFSNESCESVKSSIPVVDCPHSVCIKAVIKEPPAKRDVCVESGAIVRDCWSRVMTNSGELDPQARNNVLRLKETTDKHAETIGFIYTCKGFLCNASNIVTYYIVFTSVLMHIMIATSI